MRALRIPPVVVTAAALVTPALVAVVVLVQHHLGLAWWVAGVGGLLWVAVDETREG